MPLDLKNIEIIFVEDTAVDAALAFVAFDEAGVKDNVIHIESGEEAVEFIIDSGYIKGKQFGYTSNLIILDLHLPGLQGVEVLKRIKTNDKTKHIPVVILAASEDDPLKFTCLELGADSFITKPLTYEAFKQTVESLAHYWN